MPIADLVEARDLDAAIQALLDAPAAERERRLRAIFVEKLDLDAARGNVPLPGAKIKVAGADRPAPPATRIAQSGGVHVLWLRLPDPKITTANARVIVKALDGQMDDYLLVLSNADDSVWHIVRPSAAGGRTLLRRMVIERGLPRRTVVTQLAKVYTARRANPELSLRDAIAAAFDVEAVTQKFFTDYEKLFREIESEFKRQSKSQRWAHDYALQLLNRVMFLYFIDRKGWLEPQFLTSFWRAYQQSKRPNDTFFSEWLSVLFFEAFTNTFSHRAYMPAAVRATLQNAPYLNGGLYARGVLDDEFAAEVDDAVWLRIAKFFDSYNFTIAESTPWDQEVAVDPEMIGKVYESLVNVSEIDERGDAGIFYTPRTEIDLMCRLTVVDFLANHLGVERKPMIYDLVFAVESDEKATADASANDQNLWPDLASLLGSITAVDPACGSGSFLVGMLHVLDDLLTRADAVLGGQRTAAERKREIVGASLYGVDVMEWAVHVAELRLWLQLVIDTEIPWEERKLKPLLPNLSFKIRSGDSLVQVVGGVDMSHAHGRADLPSALKGQLTKLKGAKLDYYAGKKGHPAKEQIERAELSLFQQILDNRIAALRQQISAAQGRLRDARVEQGRLGGLAPATPARDSPAALQIEEQIESLNADLAQANDTRRALVSAKDVPFVWDIAFVEVFSGDRNGFDVVIGNPPYVRQEKIADPSDDREPTPDRKKAYKARLTHSVYARYPGFFGANPATPRHKLDAKSDLYIYFYFHGLSLLNERGSFCYITSNSWLDVGYGADLQEFLLRHGHVKLVLDNRERRSFASADVNTVIVLLAPPDDARECGLERTARFMMCTAPFEAVTRADVFSAVEAAAERSSKALYRVFPVSQRVLLDAGRELSQHAAGATLGTRARRGPLVKVAKYTGDKWGGRYLRAPESMLAAWESLGSRLTPLGRVAELRYGLKTGATKVLVTNQFADPGAGARLVPFLSSLKACRERIGNAAQLPFLIRISRRGTVAAWVEHRLSDAERDGISERPSLRKGMGADWFAMEDQEPATLIIPQFFDRRHFVLQFPHGVAYSNTFWGVYGPPPLLGWLFVLLNTSLCLLQFELLGRVNMGGGVLTCYGPDLAQVLVPQDIPNILPSIPSTVHSVGTPAWREMQEDIDRTVLATLGLSPALLRSLRDDLELSVAHRLGRAQSFRKTGTNHATVRRNGESERPHTTSR